MLFRSEQAAQAREAIRERAAAVGFDMRIERRDRIWNTFDAHRLLHWAGTLGGDAQHVLKKALLAAYFTHGRNPGAREVLLDAAAQAGLDAAEAAAVVDDPARFADAVREEEAFWQQAGIHSVPAIVINRRHLISGGQPPEVFEQALRRIAAESAGG